MESGRMESGRGAGNPQGAEDPMFRPRRFAEDVVTILRQMILSGELAAGERINEIKLADRLKISRSPIREAMQTLAGEGLVISVSGRGAFVASFDMEAVDHLLEVRATLECAAARFATVRADDASLDELEAFLMRTKDALGDTGHPYPRDLDFHEQVVAMSGNPKLMDTVRGVTTQYQLARARSSQNPGRAQAAYAEHCRIYQALRARDADAAAAAMAEHLEAAQAHVREVLRGDGAEGDSAPQKGVAAQKEKQ
jgi:GntR family transcriptional regulator, rspAB operon transcriptional repressor